MTDNTASIISKVWNFCHTLRDDGVGYGDYLEQLTFLLFLKMADEYSKPPYSRDTHIPKKYDWSSLTNKTGAELEAHYIEVLQKLGEEKGMLGQIFFKAQNKIQDPAKLYKLIQMINEESWVMLGTDVKGDIYEGLLEKNAEDTKSGAGQYFTPRTLIAAMVQCMKPEPSKTMADPACGIPKQKAPDKSGGPLCVRSGQRSMRPLSRAESMIRLQEQNFSGSLSAPGTGCSFAPCRATLSKRTCCRFSHPFLDMLV
jgi:type I restriction-modification system DNA methylase subunit